MKHSAVLILGLIVAIALVTACAAPAPTPTAPSPTAVSASPSDGTLTVYAAASLTDAFKEIAKAFQAANPGTNVEFNFAGSQGLRSQIEQSAHVDVFASADLKNMDALNAAKRIGSTPQVFARNRLVVIVPKENRAGIQALKDLSKPGLKLVIADKSVPVGNHTLQMLDKLSADATYGAGFKDAVLKNVVSQENNVKAVVSKVSLDEADAGVAYTTDAQAIADKVHKIDVPDAFNVIALYPIARIKDAPNAALAEKWIAFVLSAQGQAILSKYGFVPPS